MRVAVLSHTYVEPESRKKLYALAQQGIEVTLIVPEYWQEGALGKEWKVAAGLDHDIRVVPVRVQRLLSTPAAARWDISAIAQELSRGSFDLLHVEEEPWSLAARASVRLSRRFSVPVVLFTWQNLAHRPPWPLRMLARRVLSRCTGWVAGNQAAAELLKRVDPSRPLAVIPQVGIDPPQPESAGRDSAPPLTVGYVGRLVPEKGVADLLSALAGVDHAWRCAIVGDGPERTALELAADNLGIADRVAFRGAVPHREVEGLVRGLDVLVLPSRTTRRWAEQFGHVLLEAMAAGAVVVGSDSGAIPEVVGEAGVIFPEGDAQALARIIEELAGDPDRRSRLRVAGGERAAEFTHEHIARRLIRFWKEALGAADA